MATFSGYTMEATPSPPLVTGQAEEFLRQISPLEFSPMFLHSGIFTAKVLTPGSENYNNIKKYIRNSDAHDDFGVKLVSILQVSRTHEQYQDSFGIADNRMMLWHGTKPENVKGILESGFELPTREFQMFGKGIYFADRVSKSAQYCTTWRYPGAIGYVFLCEVQLGRIYIAEEANWNYRQAPSVFINGRFHPCDSVKGTGKQIPDEKWKLVKDDVTWWFGPTVKNENRPVPCPNLQFNEYVVYEPDQVKIKYLVKIRFTDPNEYC